MSENVVSIYPHPDDETFGKGGTLAMHVKRGDSVTVVCGTLGQMGRNMGKPFFANRETLPKIREQELRDACTALGISDLRLLGLRDKTVEFEDPEYLVSLLLPILKEVKATRVYTYYPGHGVHPDHNALAEAAVLAVSRLPENERPTIYASAISRNWQKTVGPPDVESDVSEGFEEKMNAMRAHRSQSEARMKQMEAELKEHPEKRAELEAPFRHERYWILKV